jgi:hypothetical protein
MTAVTSSVPSFFDALRSALAARPSLSGVQVSSAPMGDSTDDEEFIRLLGADGSQEFLTMGVSGARQEDYTATAEIQATAMGYGETAAKAARDRAYVLLAEVEKELALLTSSGIYTYVKRALITGVKLTQTFGQDRRYASLDITIDVLAVLYPGA